MNDDGFEYADPDEMTAPFVEAHSEWSTRHSELGRGRFGADVDRQTSRVEDVLTPAALADLEPLAAEERSAAVAALDRREAGHDVNAVINEIQAEYMAREFGD